MPESIARTNPTTTPPPRRKRSRVLRLLLAVAALIVLLAIILYALADGKPGWYRPLQPGAKGVSHLAEQAQNQLLELHNEAADPAVRSVTWTITQQQVNAWLATSSATGTVAVGQHVGGHRVDGPCIRFTPGRIGVAARLANLPGSGVLSVSFSVQTQRSTAGGKPPLARIAIHSVHVGLLPVPPGLLRARLQSLLPALAPSVRKCVEFYAGPQYARTVTPEVLSVFSSVIRGKPFPLSFRLNHRQVVVREIAVEGAHAGPHGQPVPACFTIVFSPA